MKILYGTGNAAKLNSMRKYLNRLRFDISGAGDYPLNVREIDESGNDPLENARIKAFAYHTACAAAGIDIPVFSCDSGLYFDGLPEEIQPGVHVRNVSGKRLNDNEMIGYYSELAKQYGGSITAQYKNAVCLILPDGTKYEHMGGDICGEKFYIINTPHKKRVEGFPLDSLSVEIKSGRYYYDLEMWDTSVEKLHEGFSNFFGGVFNIQNNIKA